MRSRLGCLSAVAFVCGGCQSNAPPAAGRSSLDGAVARVGTVAILPSLVGEVAAAKHVSPPQALDDLVGDALASQEAEARGLGHYPTVAWQLTAAMARRAAQHLSEEARNEGPPSAEELSSLLVLHAAVLRRPNLREEEALAVARAIRQAVLDARTPEEFIARAEAVSHPHGPVIAQRIGPFGADGQDSSGGELDPGFVAAAFSLRALHETSPIVATPFGWHVVQLVERTTTTTLEPDDRRAARAEAVARLRERMRIDAAVRAKSTTTPVEVSVAADELMARAMTAP